MTNTTSAPAASTTSPVRIPCPVAGCRAVGSTHIYDAELAAEGHAFAHQAAAAYGTSAWYGLQAKAKSFTAAAVAKALADGVCPSRVRSPKASCACGPAVVAC